MQLQIHNFRLSSALTASLDASVGPGLRLDASGSKALIMNCGSTPLTGNKRLEALERRSLGLPLAALDSSRGQAPTRVANFEARRASRRVRIVLARLIKLADKGVIICQAVTLGREVSLRIVISGVGLPF